jgi:3-deoxy-D-manno-octulosonic-acid transferase
MRWLYSGLLYTLTPLVFLRLWMRGRKAPEYRKRWNERFGHASGFENKSRIWVHAVSVGETIAAAPLVNALLEQYPDHAILVTTMTPTGSAQVERLFGDSVEHVYLPYDLPHSLNQFFNAAQPDLLIVMETELWPNLFAVCQKRGVPVVVVNARLSERSFQGYWKFRTLFKRVFSYIHVLAQAEADAARFRQLGITAQNLKVMGNLKFDQEVPEQAVEDGKQLRAALTSTRPVWIAASTHAGEDEQVLSVHRELLDAGQDCLLILVPRHPERFNEVAALVEQSGFVMSRRSQEGDPPQDLQVFVGDTLGELLMFFAASDVAFVGGSLVETGGHNPLEPAALGVPVITGPHWFNFAGIYPELFIDGAAQEVIDEEGFVAQLQQWLGDDAIRKTAGEAGRRVVQQNQGALERCLDGIKPLLEAPKSL